jgi:hypothetical protein
MTETADPILTVFVERYAATRAIAEEVTRVVTDVGVRSTNRPEEAPFYNPDDD